MYSQPSQARARKVLHQWLTGKKQINRRNVNQQAIKLIVSDVDGTLLKSDQSFSKAVQGVLSEASQRGVKTVLATGKARGPWRDNVFPLLPDQMPTVYLQGLLITKSEGDIIHQQSLEPDLVKECIEFASQNQLTLTAYSDNRILVNECDEHSDRLIFYKEPTPEAVGDLNDYLQHVPINKVIFMQTDPIIKGLASNIEQLMHGKASLTSALPGMLEVLPLGCSKGAGVQKVLDLLSVKPSEILALGDGQNDTELLKMAGVAVAMGNASEQLKGIADYVTSSNDEDGVAQAVEKYVLANGA